MTKDPLDKIFKQTLLKKLVTRALMAIGNNLYHPSTNKGPLSISKTAFPLSICFDGTTRWFDSLNTVWTPHVVLSEASDFIWVRRNLLHLSSWDSMEITKENVIEMTKLLDQEYNKRYEIKAPNIDVFPDEHQKMRAIAILIEDESVVENITHDNNSELYKILRVGRSLGFCFFVKKVNIRHPVSVAICHEINKGYFNSADKSFLKLDDNIGKEYQSVIEKIKDIEVINLFGLEISVPKVKSPFTDTSGMAYYQDPNNIKIFVEVIHKDTEGNLIVRDQLCKKIGVISSNKIQYLYKANVKRIFV